jgi:TonB-dependent SusC/RagA subfamily outer membrane receptor
MFSSRGPFCGRSLLSMVFLLMAATLGGCHSRQDPEPPNEQERRSNGNPNVLERNEMNQTASSFVELVQGRLPGVVMRQRGGAISVEIRGQGSIRGSNEALILIDGVENSGRALSVINPADVERVQVMKDGAAAIYGIRAANGVLLITTRRQP